MADQTELRMNLAAVKRTDPYAAEIVETSAHVAFYTFNYEDNEWEKTDVEGAFFVYRRTAEPFHSIFINNRLNTESLVEPVTADLELQAQPPFLLYRNERSRIRGFWFYNKDELERVASLVNKLVKECQKKHPMPSGAQPLAHLIMGGAKNMNNNAAGPPLPNGVGGMIHQHPQQPQKAPMKMNTPVNIFSMLSKAQDDFDNSNHPRVAAPQQQQQQLPQPPAHMDGASMLAALLPKMNVNGGGGGPPAGPGKDGVTSQSVMNFFASAKPTIPTPQPAPVAALHHPHHPHHSQSVPAQVLHSNGIHAGPVAGGPPPGGLKGPSPAPPPLLQRLMSNPVTTVEQIEMQHRAVTPQEVRQKGGNKEEAAVAVAKENGFHWKATAAAKGGPAAVAVVKTEVPKAEPNNGGEEMWPTLFQQKGGKGNKSKAGESTEQAPAVKGKAAVATKGQQPKSHGGGSATTGAAVPKPALMTPTMFKKTEARVDPTNPSLIPTGGKRDGGVAAAGGTAGKAGGGEGTAVSIKTKAISGGGGVDLEIKPEPLTQSQMLQAMTYLMKTDAEFIRKLHEAYVKSFGEMMAQ